ncbi:MAG TPA: hypothetical protein VK386_07100, partial [Acidimicrobiales bacterium]|nr:hypothetical protein [Acidimicrobiales bacterium]
MTTSAAGAGPADQKDDVTATAQNAGSETGSRGEGDKGRRQGRVSAWLEVLRTTNPPTGRALDPVSSWLVLTRAAVLPMTLVSGAVATLLAVRKPGFSWWLLTLAFVGITLAHMANNLMNDLFDVEVGND